jgi:hypothetical protein
MQMLLSGLTPAIFISLVADHDVESDDDSLLGFVRRGLLDRPTALRFAPQPLNVSSDMSRCL